ncbi:alpha/beta fold hydrolase [Pseudactinotalea suaedae]|uniref:alpha/beta fold hydrolase n=1 Tax=Pseudactinotalea suaedae TaxID=1524924 RepID=UPI0012E26984|nr:alpha/beta hydrolase [Pseudactinotalea suaedae]
MGGYDLWYADLGDAAAPPLVLLHPGGVDARAFAPNLEALGAHLRLLLPERRGHGHVADDARPLSFETDAADTIAFLEEVVGGPVRLLGYSDGGIVGLRVAAQRPDLVERFAMVAAPFHRDGWADGVLDELDEGPPAAMARSHGEVSPDGAEHYPILARKLAELHRREPAMTTTELAAVDVRTLLMVADDDEVTLEHASAAYRAMPRAELAVVPGTSHGLLWEKPELCHAILLDFLLGEPPPLLAPRRRRPS